MTVFLLIVPEGIEIKTFPCKRSSASILLIVPEGIEMDAIDKAVNELEILLIVPEGIEIVFFRMFIPYPLPF